LASYAIAQRNGYGAFGGGLTHDVLIELNDDFAGSQFVEGRHRLLFLLALLPRKIDHHDLPCLSRLIAPRW